jgi:hypothetical protein
MQQSSFPFLALANKFNVPYVDVLEQVERWLHGPMNPPKDARWPTILQHEIVRVCRLEHSRRASIAQIKQDTINGKFIPPNYDADLRQV